MATSTETEIANLALQMVGGARIAAGALRTEQSKNADEVRSCYHVLRRAELRRNVWWFATRRAAMRPFGTDSRFVTFPAWASGTTYAVNNVVLYSGQLYYSKIAGNLGNTPDTSFAQWSQYYGSDVAQLHVAGEKYLSAELVYVGAAVYLSLNSANETTPPDASWLDLTGATVATLVPIYPLGAGPVSSSDTRNIYVLPVGYMRMAPLDPKVGSVSQLGASSAMAYGDELIEDRYLVTRDAGLKIIRFVADIADPALFDPMFVAGFAARIAFTVCEPISQSTSKKAGIASEYLKFMSEARLVNGIETGPTEAPEDDFISCRR